VWQHKFFTLPEHVSSSPVFSGVCVAQFLVSCLVFCRSYFYFISLLCCVLETPEENILVSSGYEHFCYKEKLEDTKGVIRRHKSKKDTIQWPKGQWSTKPSLVKSSFNNLSAFPRSMSLSSTFSVLNSLMVYCNLYLSRVSQCWWFSPGTPGFFHH
jgi:hypothetical protein